MLTMDDLKTLELRYARARHKRMAAADARAEAAAKAAEARAKADGAKAALEEREGHTGAEGSAREAGIYAAAEASFRIADEARIAALETEKAAVAAERDAFELLVSAHRNKNVGKPDTVEI